MSTYASVTGNLASSASAAYTLGQGLDRSISGDSRKVHFIQSNKTILEFDAVVSEQHTQDAGPTVFPLEDGSTITDHVIVTPFELSLSGVISDSRLSADLTGGQNGAVNRLTQEGITSGANLVAGPLGVLAAGAASKLSPSLLAQRGTTSPSTAAYNALTLLIAGNKATGVMPSLFDVVTSLKRYPNMILRSLQVPRDDKTGGALVFNMSLVQMLIVQPQTTTIRVFTNKAVAAHKANLGDKEAEKPSRVLAAYNQGKADINSNVPDAVLNYAGVQ